MLNPLRRIQFTEYDATFKLWLPLFDHLFVGSSISTRIAGTSNQFTAATKRMVDIAPAEIALDGTADNNTINGNANFLRGGKDIPARLPDISLEQRAALP
ncbi:hypothetical protein BCR43DRAFT_513646 [Syncephalastrum racemosum]|uniref:Uncharacterized protein n=1 Tax=Syncephalastrum racemosum TaxID=13706 RepID=A0A1X2HFH9_SYNRA|nr:hypothetical protein BCR43DRAFT_513646 [Syncephalastrum racemosum]